MLICTKLKKLLQYLIMHTSDLVFDKLLKIGKSNLSLRKDKN